MEERKGKERQKLHADVKGCVGRVLGGLCAKMPMGAASDAHQQPPPPLSLPKVFFFEIFKDYLCSGQRLSKAVTK